jgi:putative glutamine amidotransferase
MPDGPLVAVPHWRAPTWERTRFYYDALEASGARHAIVDTDDLPNEARGLLLTGGVDVDPHLYSEKPGPNTDRPNTKRDQHELKLLRQALDRDIPVLCICRGHELLNVSLGGSLLQHIETDGHRWHDDGTSGWHEVTMDGDSRLAAVYGKASVLHVNSRHHQGVTQDRLAGTLRPTARSADGFIEAMESANHRWVVGIQWHPERPEPELEPASRENWNQASSSLWHAFVAACSLRLTTVNR